MLPKGARNRGGAVRSLVPEPQRKSSWEECLGKLRHGEGKRLTQDTTQHSSSAPGPQDARTGQGRMSNMAARTDPSKT